MTDIEVEAFEEMYTPEEREEIHKQVEENIRMRSGVETSIELAVKKWGTDIPPKERRWLILPSHEVRCGYRPAEPGLADVTNKS
jgi:hypothetical protein